MRPYYLYTCIGYQLIANMEYQIERPKRCLFHLKIQAKPDRWFSTLGELQIHNNKVYVHIQAIYRDMLNTVISAVSNHEINLLF